MNIDIVRESPMVETLLVMKILQELFDSIPFQDLKHRVRSYREDATDEKLEVALKELEKQGLIEISKQQVGTRSERIISLTRRGFSRSASASVR